LIQSLVSQGYLNIVLLGGPEDTIRNQQISFDMPVVNSPTTAGLRDGIVSIEACDIVVTGDSLGMHLAIARKKQVIAWFGPTCAHEIDLFGMGETLVAPVSCGPCWLRQCNKPQMCYDSIAIETFVGAINRSVVEHQRRNFLNQPEIREIKEL
jgi:heptosyltransferase-2